MYGGQQPMKEVRICPTCGRLYYEEPALSRKDNKTLICSDCGTQEAMELAIQFMNRNEYVEPMIPYVAEDDDDDWLNDL